MHRVVGHLDANGAQADHTQGLAPQFRAHKLALALFHQRAHRVALALEPGGPGQRRGQVAAGQHQPADGQFGHRVAVGARGVKDHNALLAAFVQGNIVHPRARPGDGQQAVGQGHIMHLGAAHQDTLGLVAVVVHPEKIGRELGKPRGRDAVEGLDGKHAPHSFIV